MITKIKNLINRFDFHTKEVIEKSIVSSFVKAGGIFIGLAVSIFIGQMLGPEGVGIINLSNKIVQIVVLVGLLGMRQVIVKEIAIAKSDNNLQKIGDVMSTSYIINGGFTLILSLLFILLSPYLANNVFKIPELQWPLAIFFIVMVPQVFSRIFCSGLIGYQKIWQSALVDQNLSLFVTGTILFCLWLFDAQITIIKVAISYAIGRIIVSVVTGLYWHSLYSHKLKTKLIFNKLRKTAQPFLVISLVGVILNGADLIILGIFEDSKNVGLYAVAKRISMISVIFLQITNSAVAPKVAVLYKSKKFKDLELVLRNITLILLVIGFIFVVVFIFFGTQILTFWGEQFVDAYLILILLSIGQLVNLGTGAVGIVLIMSGFEKIQKNISLIFMILNISLNLFLIYFFGVLGAAIASMVSIVGINITKYYFVQKKTGIKLVLYYKK